MWRHLSVALSLHRQALRDGEGRQQPEVTVPQHHAVKAGPMHKLRCLSAAVWAKDLHRSFTRLKSSEGRPSAPLGSRILTNPDDIFKHNMWDHVQWSEEDKENARRKARENSSVQIPLKEQGKFDTEAYQYWDRFYEQHQDRFFKDRKWLFLEFPELLPPAAAAAAVAAAASGCQARVPARSGPVTQTEARRCTHSHPRAHTCQEAGPEPPQTSPASQHTSFPGQHAAFRILEVGCGVGNSVFPIINAIKENNAFLYCCDFSPCAINLLKEHPDYNESVCHAFVRDLCEDETPLPFPPQSLDVVLAVFVLSSIHPERLAGVVSRLSSCLKPGGVFLFRDYGRYDLAQLRFKKGQCLFENFYTRGDGTCAYFFTKEEVHGLFSEAGLEKVQNVEDRRLQVNRGKKVVMQRVWMQSKYRKP